MDPESRQVNHQSSSSLELESDTGSVHSFSQPDAHCFFCSQAFTLETETNEVFEAAFICRDCKLVFDNFNRDLSSRDSNQRRQQRRVSSESSESTADLFQQQFSELLSIVRSNQEALQRVSYSTYQSRSRWHQALSDNGSESLDHVDSLFAENGSHVSFNGNVGESDTSLDGHGLVERGIFMGQDDESHISSDTDIDPMRAGLDQWNSDEDGEWEDVDVEEVAGGITSQERQTHYASSSSTQSNGGDSRSDGWLFWRSRESRSLRYSDLDDMEEPELPHYFWNEGDYLDARGFDALLEQLAETDGSRKGAPPAAAAIVNGLPSVIISKAHEKNGYLICAVCKDLMKMGTEATRLPCSHFYHHSCIVPWLCTRNSCPVCRYELPTDDPDYEDKKNAGGRREPREIQQQNVIEEHSSAMSSDAEIDTAHGEVEGDVSEAGLEEASFNGQWRRGWIYRAAAPIVSIASVIMVMWLGNPLAERPFHHRFQEHASQEIPRSLRTDLARECPVHRNRRWWSFF